MDNTGNCFDSFKKIKKSEKSCVFLAFIKLFNDVNITNPLQIKGGFYPKIFQ